MTTPQYNILFPVDFSDRSVLAARHVKTWVDRFGAVLNTLHIVDPEVLGYSAELSDEFLSKDLPLLMVKRTADLKYFSDHYFGENVARQTVLSGGTADQIESFAKRENVDLIMLPRNHQNIASRVLRDSLTATILERCTASVWTTEHVELAESLSISSILCAVHFEEDVTLESQNSRILQNVKKLAAAFHAKVTCLRVIGKHEKTSTKFSADLDTVSGVEPWLAQAREQLESSTEFIQKSGDVVTAISDTANEVDANLIVVGRSRPGTISLGVQIHVLKIDHAVRRPVLSIG